MSRHFQVRLKAEEPAVAALPGVGEDRLDLPVSLARGDDLAVLEQRVLDVNVDRVRLE